MDAEGGSSYGWSSRQVSTAFNPGASADGLRGSEGTFSLGTFMCVDALARGAGSKLPG